MKPALAAVGRAAPPVAGEAEKSTQVASDEAPGQQQAVIAGGWGGWRDGATTRAAAGRGRQQGSAGR